MQSSNPIFSIIVPCYNQEKYLEECLVSVLNQTYKDWECIIVNDGSTDNSEKIALEFKRKDSRFVLISKTNEGLSATRNYGINHSRGTYILPLDGDDKIGENYILEASKIFLSKPNTKLIYCKAKFFGLTNENWNLPLYSYSELLFQNSIFCSAIYKKCDFLTTQGYDLNMKFGYEDWEFWLQLLSKSDSVIEINNIHFYYRKKGESMIDFVQNEEKLTQMTSYMFQKHEAKYYEALHFTKNLKGFNTQFSVIKNLKTIKSSYTYKTIYKLEKEIRRFLLKFRKK